MVNSIIRGLSISIDSLFNTTENGNIYTIYSEEIEQGLNPPCFYIKVLETAETQLLYNRTLTRVPFDILYFPQNSNSRAEMYEVAESLKYGLKWITLENGDLMFSLNRNYDIIDGVLHFRLEYQFTSNEYNNCDVMQTFEMKINTK